VTAEKWLLIGGNGTRLILAVAIRKRQRNRHSQPSFVPWKGLIRYDPCVSHSNIRNHRSSLEPHLRRKSDTIILLIMLSRRSNTDAVIHRHTTTSVFLRYQNCSFVSFVLSDLFLICYLLFRSAATNNHVCSRDAR